MLNHVPALEIVPFCPGNAVSFVDSCVFRTVDFCEGHVNCEVVWFLFVTFICVVCSVVVLLKCCGDVCDWEVYSELVVSVVGWVDELTWDDVVVRLSVDDRVVEMSSVVSVFDRAVELLRLCVDGLKLLCVVEDTSVEAGWIKPVKTDVIV